MDFFLLIVLAIVVIGLIVGAIAWFGPRPGQWKTHDGRPTERAELLHTLPEGDETNARSEAETDKDEQG